MVMTLAIVFMCLATYAAYEYQKAHPWIIHVPVEMLFTMSLWTWLWFVLPAFYPNETLGTWHCYQWTFPLLLWTNINAGIKNHIPSLAVIILQATVLGTIALGYGACLGIPHVIENICRVLGKAFK